MKPKLRKGFSRIIMISIDTWDETVDVCFRPYPHYSPKYLTKSIYVRAK